jgi:hypothetical protein
MEAAVTMRKIFKTQILQIAERMTIRRVRGKHNQPAFDFVQQYRAIKMAAGCPNYGEDDVGNRRFALRASCFAESSSCRLWRVRWLLPADDNTSKGECLFGRNRCTIPLICNEVQILSFFSETWIEMIHDLKHMLAAAEWLKPWACSKRSASSDFDPKKHAHTRYLLIHNLFLFRRVDGNFHAAKQSAPKIQDPPPTLGTRYTKSRLL